MGKNDEERRYMGGGTKKGGPRHTKGTPPKGLSPREVHAAVSRLSADVQNVQSVHRKVTAADVHSITLDSLTDSVTVVYNIDPDGTGRLVETSKTFFFTEGTPKILAQDARNLAESVVSAIQGEQDYAPPVACDTCSAACCRLGWEIRVTAADVMRMHRAGLDVNHLVSFYNPKFEFAPDLRPQDTWTGFCGSLKTHEKKNPVTGEKQDVCRSLDNKSGRCSIYDSRPKVCRDYDWTSCDIHEKYDDKKRHLPVVKA